MAGQPVHFEIPSDDTAKGRAFWGGLFGWEFGDPYPGPGEYYPARLTDESGVAVTNMEPGKRGIRTYFDTDDIKASAKKVTELGGEAGEVMPVPAMGWFSVCKDSEGNEFGLWQVDTEAPAPGA
jgi:predicted enzyme related to lactoylglutathione lyase